jgi:transcription antitermination factor NusG
MAEKKWHAIYVKSRHEKKVALELKAQNIEYYLPLERVLRQWSDRKKWVEEPLFRSYIFVCVDQKDYYKALYVPGALKYVTFEGKAVVVPPQQIEAIKFYLNEKTPLDIDNSQMKEGQKVEVIAGKLTGLQGTLVQVNDKKRVKVEIEVVNSAVFVQIPRNRLRIIE